MSLMLQNLVHKLEVGAGVRWIRIGAGVIVILAIIVGYNLRAFHNFSTAEAMDQAQLARNLSEGHGYTTKCVRPFSMFLLKRANRERLNKLTPEQTFDLCVVKAGHPDLANPPVYPLLLAGLMKTGVLPKTADTSAEKSFWFQDKFFVRYAPDFAVSAFNQVLLLLLVVMTFFLARRLFDVHVAWLAAVLVFACELLWRFSVSGLSTMLLALLFMALIWALIRFEAQVEDPATIGGMVIVTAVLIGALVGVGMLTRYAYGVLIFPVLGFVLAFGGRWRVQSTLAVAAVFALVAAPWIVRNISICGEPFGIAGYAPIETSVFFPGDQLQRSLDPNLAQISLTPIWWKFFGNMKRVLLDEVPAMGGGYIFAFFLVGLMIPFRSKTLSHIRFFTLGALAMFIVAQALGRTSLSDESPVINTENLLILLVPLVIVYGVGLFQILLDQAAMPIRGLRLVVKVLFGVVITLPMIMAFMPPKTNPLAFPPYYPPSIQKIAGWMKESELTMTDIPWAVAWYGDRQAVLKTLDVHSRFYAINDYIKPISAIYLSPRTLDAKFLSEWSRGGSEFSWGALVMASLTREELPPGFPLHKSYRLPEQLYFTDWERWLKKSSEQSEE